MPKMDGKGPQKEGPKTGRKLGTCSDDQKKQELFIGKGMGKRRNSGGGAGLGKRLRYDADKSRK